MGSFKLGGMTFGSLFKKPETLLYPFETRPAPAGLKGHVAIDPSTCILCGICQRVCPAMAIDVEKKQRTWTINPFQCVQCNSCIYACPKSSLAMEPSAPPVATDMTSTTVDIPDPKAAAAAE